VAHLLHILPTRMSIFSLLEVHFFQERRDCDKALEADQINGVVVNYSVDENWMKDQACRDNEPAEVVE
jgi:hypothetical protein